MSHVVLVTGCSTGGIGYSLCEEFGRKGCKVYATSRRVESIAPFSDETIERLALDVNSDESVAEVVAHIIEKEGHIDIVVNNAGLISPGPMVDIPLEDVKQVFETNTFATLRICKAVTPIMAKRKSGTIVNIGSVVGEAATPWNGIYCATKAAVLSISEVLSMELRPLGISVVHIAPAAIRSNISANGHARFSLAPDSLFAAYLPDIIRRINASQGPSSMPSEMFAQKVVRGVLREPPVRYMLLGGGAWMWKLFKWIPKSIVLGLLWRTYSKMK